MQVSKGNKKPPQGRLALGAGAPWLDGQWQCDVPALVSRWQPLESVPPEWASASPEASSNAIASNFFIFVSMENPTGRVGAVLSIALRETAYNQQGQDAADQPEKPLLIIFEARQKPEKATKKRHYEQDGAK